MGVMGEEDGGLMEEEGSAGRTRGTWWRRFCASGWLWTRARLAVAAVALRRIEAVGRPERRRLPVSDAQSGCVSFEADKDWTAGNDAHKYDEAW